MRRNTWIATTAGVVVLAVAAVVVGVSVGSPRARAGVDPRGTGDDDTDPERHADADARGRPRRTVRRDPGRAAAGVPRRGRPAVARRFGRGAGGHVADRDPAHVARRPVREPVEPRPGRWRPCPTWCRRSTGPRRRRSGGAPRQGRRDAPGVDAVPQPHPR
ncbi:hypothetical protein Q9Q99_04600 [Curtobacterium flaccumfaciens]|nr:hypothetical protein Q9Q99_04600 [Curtobacterium flaccumfaciens]